MSLLLLATWLLPSASATVVDTFGAGAASVAMGGGGIALPLDAGAVFLNPAAMVHLPNDHELVLSYAVSRSQFTAFPDLWWDQNRDGTLSDLDEPIAFQPEYDSNDGILLGTSQDLGPRLSLGMAAYVPKDRLLTLHTFEPDLPYYFMYASRLQRYALAGALSIETLPGLSIGAGFRMVPRVYYDISATLDVALLGASDDTESVVELVDSMELDVHEMTVLLVPDVAPTLGFDWDIGRMFSLMRGLSVAGTWRGSTGLPVEVTADLQVNVTADELGDLGPILLPVVIGLGLGVYDHYMPEQWTLGLAYEPRPRIAGYVDVKYTEWQQMAINIAEVVELDITTPLWEIDPESLYDGNSTYVVLKNTWAISGGLEYRTRPVPISGSLEYLLFRLRCGGGIEPTPLVEQWATSALLDSDRWRVSGGAGVEHRDPLGMDSSMQWNAFAQYQGLLPGTYRREMPDEPTSGFPREASSNGTADIDIGGHLFMAGLQVSVQY